MLLGGSEVLFVRGGGPVQESGTATACLTGREGPVAVGVE